MQSRRHLKSRHFRFGQEKHSRMLTKSRYFAPTTPFFGWDYRYYSIITNPQPNTVSVSTEGRGGEADEVGAISWIPISRIDDFEWAFEHNLRIAELVKELELV